MGGTVNQGKLADGADQVLTDFFASYFYQLLKFLASKIVKTLISLVSATQSVLLCYNSPNKLINLKLDVKPYEFYFVYMSISLHFYFLFIFKLFFE